MSKEKILEELMLIENYNERYFNRICPLLKICKGMKETVHINANRSIGTVKKEMLAQV